MIALLIIWMTLAVEVAMGVRVIRMLMLMLLLADRRLQDTQDEILAGRCDLRDLPTLPVENFLLAAIHPAAKATMLKIESWIPFASPSSWSAT